MKNERNIQRYLLVTSYLRDTLPNGLFVLSATRRLNVESQSSRKITQTSNCMQRREQKTTLETFLQKSNFCCCFVYVGTKRQKNTISDKKAHDSAKSNSARYRQKCLYTRTYIQINIIISVRVCKRGQAHTDNNHLSYFAMPLSHSQQTSIYR